MRNNIGEHAVTVVAWKRLSIFYLRHLGELDDWDYQREDSEALHQLKAIKSQHMWMVEVSVPDLF